MDLAFPRAGCTRVVEGGLLFYFEVCCEDLELVLIYCKGHVKTQNF